MHAAMGSGAVAVAIGILVGIMAAAALTRFMENLLFGVSPADPSILALSIVVILAATVVAVRLPLRRALSIEPVRAMRAE